VKWRVVGYDVACWEAREIVIGYQLYSCIWSGKGILCHPGWDEMRCQATHVATVLGAISNGTRPLPPPPPPSLLSSHRATTDDHAALWVRNLFVSSPLLAMWQWRHWLSATASSAWFPSAFYKFHDFRTLFGFSTIKIVFDGTFIIMLQEPNI
jgi:hypothetical protein